MAPLVTIDKTNSKRTLLHMFSMWIWIGWLNLHFVLLSMMPFLYFKAKIVFFVVLASLIFLAILSIKPEDQLKIFYDFGEWLVRKASDYFHLKVLVEDPKELEQCSPAIFAFEPHHVLPISIFSVHPRLNAIPGHKCAALLTSACFAIPIMRHIYTWSMAYSVDKQSIMRLIEQGMSPVLCPGGAHEVAYLTNNNECTLYLRKRLGFIKLAFLYGIPLVPAFVFGLHNSFDYLVIKNEFLQNYGRKIGFLPILYFGLWGSIFGPSKPCDYTVVIGSPIKVPKKANPTEEELLEIQKLYIDATIALFHKYKHENNMSHITLQVI